MAISQIHCLQGKELHHVHGKSEIWIIQTNQQMQKSLVFCYKFEKELLLGYFSRVSEPLTAPSNAHVDIRWWAIAKGPGTNMGASSPLSVLKSEKRFWFCLTPLQIWSTLAAAVLCAFSYSAKERAFLTSSLLCHRASIQTSIAYSGYSS